MSTVQHEPIDNVKKEIEEKLRIEYEAAYVKKVTEIRQQLVEQNKKDIEELFKQWKKEQQPPTTEDISLLLSQEYVEFPIKIRERGVERTFVIRELPQEVEKKIYRNLKSVIVSRLGEVSNLFVKMSDVQDEKRLITILELFEPTFDVLAETVALILDPFGEEKIDKTWVQGNVSTFRQWNIAIAQDHANRIRDFFFNVSRSSPKGKLMGVSTRN